MPADPVESTCDPNIIGRVITNLVDNAAKFTPEGGEVVVSVKDDLTHIEVTVSDKGCGIPEKDQNRIFEKFGQVELREERKKYSSGLGLTFCKLAVEAHGGTIAVDSKVGQGSTFKFRLPVTPPV